jgi:hypothetical protein
MRHLAEEVDGRPIHVVGYSNGGALAVYYGLESLGDESLPRVAKITLLSPAIGVTALARFAVWQTRLGRLLGLEKLAWNSVQPEYDPFKYGSFAVNAGFQVFRITTEIQKEIARRASSGELDEFPPVLAFQSVVDATVSTPALVDALMEELPSPENELVLFDIQREIHIDELLTTDPTTGIESIANDRTLPFAFNLVTNEETAGNTIVVRRTEAGGGETREIPTDMAWPPGVYSLAHISLPFPHRDPLYGGSSRRGDEDGGRIALGNLALRGERGVLQVSPSDMLRQRWNPFYQFVEDHAAEFFGFGDGE